MGQQPPARPLLVYSEDLTGYSYGPHHPMGPDRVRLTVELADYFHLLDLVEVAAPDPLPEDLLARVHDPEYLAALDSGAAHPEFGIGTEDHPVVPGLAAHARAVAAGTLHATRAVWEGTHPRALNISGGLHHAGRRTQAGFCMLNDAAVAIEWLLQQGATRVAYLDLDAHHGDGVEQLFWDDPRVLTISVHESGLFLFPGTGFGHEIGGPHAAGTAVNVALEPATGDMEWLQAVHAIVPPLLQKFRPQILISQHGADGHASDPLTHLELSVDAMGKSYRSVARWAERFAGGRWVALGGGGYQRDAVARTWVHVLAAVAGVKLDGQAPMPADWEARARVAASPTLGDAGAAQRLQEYHPERVLSDTPAGPVVATSRHVFPYWGLVPYRG
ncbi:acetoin utilization protein AcuC [Corynebacterium sp. 13CS0277]|nr:acetoin utilization protein AcuC [Corynebacterium sp. 13CS0277]